MKEIRWFEKKGSIKIASDVSVRLYGTKGGNKRTTFVFRNDCAVKISTTDYMKVGIGNDKVYFAESHAGVGYKISRNGTSDASRRVVIPAVLEEFIGDYDLHIDGINRCWFIQKGET